MPCLNGPNGKIGTGQTRPARRLGLAMLAGLVGLTMASPALAQSLVVRSTGPSATKYPAGTKLSSTDRIALQSGDRIVVLDRGTTRTLSGPGTFRASDPVRSRQTTGSTVIRMMSSDSAMRARGGFTRAAGETADLQSVQAPNLWLLDIRHGGNFCVMDPARLRLWRPDENSDALVQWEAATSDAPLSGSIAFVRGQNFRDWPAEAAPLQFGIGYRLSGPDMPQPIEVQFAPFEGNADDPATVAEQLLVKGCTAQLDRLVDVMAAEDSSAG